MEELRGRKGPRSDAGISDSRRLWPPWIAGLQGEAGGSQVHPSGAAVTKETCRDTTQGERGDVPWAFPSFYPQLLPVAPIGPPGQKASELGSWETQLSEASPPQCSKARRGRGMGQDAQAPCTSHRSQGKKWSANFAPGLSYLGPGPPGPGVSCLGPSLPRLCCSCCPPLLSPPRSRPCPGLDLGPLDPECQQGSPYPECAHPQSQLSATSPASAHSAQHGSVPAQERHSSAPLMATVLQFTTSPVALGPHSHPLWHPESLTIGSFPSDVLQLSHPTANLH